MATKKNANVRLVNAPSSLPSVGKSIDRHFEDVDFDELVNSFELFATEPISDLVKFHEFVNSECLVKVFFYVPKKKEKKSEVIVDLEGTKSSQSRILFLPVGKVLASGPDCKYKQGEIVKLKDSDVRTVVSEKFVAHAEHPGRNSNMDVASTTPPPPKYKHQIFDNFGRKYFCLNPLQILPSKDDRTTFLLFEANISNRLIDVDDFINLIRS